MNDSTVPIGRDEPQFFWLFYGWPDELRDIENGIISPPYIFDPSMTVSECGRRFACRLILSCEAVIIPRKFRQFTETALEEILRLRERISPSEWDRLRSLAISMRVREIRREALTKRNSSDVSDC